MGRDLSVGIGTDFETMRLGDWAKRGFIQLPDCLIELMSDELL